MPVLAGGYLFFSSQLSPRLFPHIVLSEFIFCYIFFIAVKRLNHTSSQREESTRQRLTAAGSGLLIMCLAAVFFISLPSKVTSSNVVISNLFHYGAVFCLIAVLNTAWNAETFWRTLTSNQRWQYKFFILGIFLTCGSLGWAFSYRLMYPIIKEQHLILLASLLLLSAGMISYALARHRLLNRKIFIARQVVYSFIAPTLLALYLTCLGGLAFITKHYGYEIHFVLFWFTLISGLVVCLSLIFSDDVRKKVKYFVSTNFYNNKYEYRDEWLAFSSLLKEEFSELGVVKALTQILTDCLYTNEIIIWLGDSENGYKPISTDESQQCNALLTLQSDDPLLSFLKENNFLYTKDSSKNPSFRQTLNQKKHFLNNCRLELFFPMTIGKKMVGLIGLGPEYTGGRYGQDDFDLLLALSTQAASAVLSVRMAEKLAMAREKEAIDTLSAFVLHDIKNAAAMLSLVQSNAAEHIANPEFQKDMLETIDDALKRMNKVQTKIATLKEGQKPELNIIDLGFFIEQFCHKIAIKFSKITIECDCSEAIYLKTNQTKLGNILENILLNAFEAEATKVMITVTRTNVIRQVTILISDNGKGINKELLPNRLFDPYVSNKSGGSGIGLWQVKQMVKQLSGDIRADNKEKGGAIFTIMFSE
nr:PEP-CTERM system histidine kinase PrsK [Desulfobulbaceae bacterium]